MGVSGIMPRLTQTSIFITSLFNFTKKTYPSRSEVFQLPSGQWVYLFSHKQKTDTKPRRLRFVFTALHGMQTRSYDENSVRPSVCPSVKRVHCDKTEESYV